MRYLVLLWSRLVSPLMQSTTYLTTKFLILIIICCISKYKSKLRLYYTTIIQTLHKQIPHDLLGNTAISHRKKFCFCRKSIGFWRGRNMVSACRRAQAMSPGTSPKSSSESRRSDQKHLWWPAVGKSRGKVVLLKIVNCLVEVYTFKNEY